MESFLQGAISGGIGILLSHPLDTIKTRIQTGKFSLRGLYAGVSNPMYSVVMEKAIVFGVYDRVKNHLNSNEIWASAVAGGVAGAVSPTIVTPFEKFKIQKQIGMQTQFCLKNLYRGYWATLAREIPGFVVYFSVFDSLYSPNLSYPQVACLGGFTGIASWSAIYPQDVVKTHMQTTQTGNIINTIKLIYSRQGLAGFYKGYTLALLRAVPLHAGTLTTFVFLNRKIEM